VRTAARMTPVLTAALVGLAPAVNGQVSVAVGVGSVFDGASFGVHVGSYAPGSAFFGASIGLGWRSHRGGGYGIYSDTWDGWHHYRPRSSVRIWASSYACWDWDPFYWDPWYDAYDCGWRPYWSHRSF